MSARLVSTGAFRLMNIAVWHRFGGVRTPKRGGADVEGLTRAWAMMYIVVAVSARVPVTLARAVMS